MPSCECAIIKVQGHNFTALPSGVVKMPNIKRLMVQNGPLKYLPNGMEKLNKLSTLAFQHSELEEFNIDTSSFTSLMELKLDFNQLKSVHESLWVHPTIAVVSLNSNVGLAVPSDPNKIKLRSAITLDLRNNSVLLPEQLGIRQLPNVFFLLLNGNKFHGNVLPKSFETFKQRLTRIYVSQTGLKSLPAYLATFSLTYLDARDNNISSVPLELQKSFDQTNMKLHLSGNKELCFKDERYKNSEACEPLCSIYCYSTAHHDNYCDNACNSKQCNYDDGDCKNLYPR